MSVDSWKNTHKTFIELTTDYNLLDSLGSFHMCNCDTQYLDFRKYEIYE